MDNNHISHSNVDKHCGFLNTFPEYTSEWENCGHNFIKLYGQSGDDVREKILQYLNINNIDNLKPFYTMARISEKRFLKKIKELEDNYKKFGNNIIIAIEKTSRLELCNLCYFLNSEVKEEEYQTELNRSDNPMVLELQSRQENIERDRDLLRKQLELKNKAPIKTGGLSIKNKEMKKTEAPKLPVRSIKDLDKILNKK